MAHPAGFPFEIHRISRHQAPHESRKISGRAVKKEMEMVRHERPRKTCSIEAGQVVFDPSPKLPPVAVVRENSPFFDPPRINMVKCAGEIDPWNPGHGNNAGKGCAQEGSATPSKSSRTSLSFSARSPEKPRINPESCSLLKF